MTTDLLPKTPRLLESKAEFLIHERLLCENGALVVTQPEGLQSDPKRSLH